MGPIIMAAKIEQDQHNNDKNNDEINLEIDNWEEIDESSDVLEKKFHPVIMPSLQEEERLIKSSLEMGPTTTTVHNNKIVTLSGDEALRSQYVHVPPEPAVKILKRPIKGATNLLTIDNNRKALPKKTLQQREQEYAEARLRILGEATSSSTGGEKTTEEKMCIVNKPNNNKSSEIVDNNIITRLPKCPDGTNGFNIRR